MTPQPGPHIQCQPSRTSLCPLTSSRKPSWTTTIFLIRTAPSRRRWPLSPHNETIIQPISLMPHLISTY